MKYLNQAMILAAVTFAAELIKLLLPKLATHSRLSIRTVRISRELGCCIAYIDFFLVIYIGEDKRSFQIRRR